MNTLNDMQIGTKLSCDFAIGHIHESGENAISATETAVDTSAKSRELLHDALDGVDEIIESINMVRGMAQDINSGTKHVPDVVKRVVAGMDDVASISDTGASVAEESPLPVGEQTSVIRALTAETQWFSDVAHELMGGLDKFTVAEDEYD